MTEWNHFWTFYSHVQDLFVVRGSNPWTDVSLCWGGVSYKKYFYLLSLILQQFQIIICAPFGLALAQPHLV